MERVQFQQEQMLQELKDLVERNLFTEKETKQIIKTRTAFETALVRRVAKKADFLRYATYEMGLEQLRRKRITRLNIPKGPPTISDYALVRRQFHIFERALKKFKSDIELWIQYIQLAKHEGARALVGKITARALQLHPNQPSLYVLAAAHELEQLSPSAARVLLQRGIRLNPESIELWTEYVKMELGFIESIRRRWDVLGIKNFDNGANGKGKEQEDLTEKIIGVGSDSEQRDSIELSELDNDEGASTRRQILGGAIVRSVMTSASSALPKIELFESLKTLITEYPLSDDLRNNIVNHLYDLLRQTLPENSKALRLLATRFVKPGLTEGEFIERLHDANVEFQKVVEDWQREDGFEEYSKFIEDMFGEAIDGELKKYLISSLKFLIQRMAVRSPSLQTTHNRLLIRQAAGDPASPAKVLYTNK